MDELQVRWLAKIGLAALSAFLLTQWHAVASAQDLAALSLDKPAVIGGATVIGTVTLLAEAPPGGVAIFLSSSDVAASVPASVTVQQGATSATFNIGTSAVWSRAVVTVQASYSFSDKTARLVVNPPLPASILDIDGDGSYDPATDGLLALRYLFGIGDALLIDEAVGANAVRKTSIDVTDYLDWVRPALDIDQNNVLDPLTDGLMILRYLYGVRGDALLSGAIGPLAQRKDVAAVENYLLSLKPPTANLVINEVNPNITGSRDLVELRVVSGGSVAGVKLEMDLISPVKLADLPPILVVTDDLIVVHMTPAADEPSELGTKQECLASTCFAAAWDVAGAAVGIPFSNRILVLRKPGGIIDAVPFALPAGTTTTFPQNLQALQSAGLWSPANCGGALCTYVSTPTAIDVSVDWSGSSATNSVQRKPGADTNSKTDWQGGGSQTFGAPNP